MALPNTLEPMIEAEDAARYLGVHVVTIRRWAAKGVVPALKIGKVLRFLPSSLDEWRRSQIESGTALRSQSEKR